MIIFSEDELLAAFENLEEQNVNVMSAVTEVQIVVASYSPLTWQANVKTRDRSLPWGTGVADNPGDALVKAVRAALGLAKGSAYFYPKKPLAEEFAKKIEAKYRKSIGYVRVEFEPYRGFVVVVSPKDGEGDSLVHLKGKVEFRVGSSSRASAPHLVEEPGVAETLAPLLPKSSAPSGSMPDKGTMDRLWKEKKGKFPPREWKKADLWKKIKQEGLA